MDQRTPRLDRIFLVALGTSAVDLVLGFLRAFRAAGAAIFDTLDPTGYADHRTQAYHVAEDGAGHVPCFIPTRRTDQEGADGAAFRSNFARRLLEGMRGLIESVFEHGRQGIGRLVVVVSAMGGTGTGGYRLFSGIARRVVPESVRLVFVHFLVRETGRESRIKQWIRLSDLGSPDRRPSEVHVLLSRPDRFEEVAGLSSAAWHDVKGLELNMPVPPAASRFYLMLLRRVVYSESEIAAGVLAWFFSTAVPRRLCQGQPGLAPAQWQQQMDRFRTGLHVLRTLPDRRPPAAFAEGLLDEAQNGDEALRAQTNTHLQRAADADNQDLERHLGELRALRPIVGLDRLRPLIEAEVARLEEQEGRLDAALQTVDVQRLRQEVVRAASALRYTFGRHQQAHGVVDRMAAHAAQYYRRWLSGTVSERLGALLGVPALHTNGTRPFALAEDAPLLGALLETYFAAPDDQSGRHAVERYVDLHRAEVVRQGLLPVLRDELAFDERISATAETYRALVVRSRFGSELSLLADQMNVRPPYRRFPVRSDQTIELIHFVPIHRLIDLPDVAQMTRRVEAEDFASDDRDLFSREAADLFPPRLRDGFAVDPEEAALLLARAFLLPGVVRVEKNRILVAPPGAPAAGYACFDELSGRLPVLDERAIHTAFWNEWFSSNRGRAVSVVSRLAAGDVPAADRQRFARLRAFTGSRRWDAALRVLQRQVTIAHTHWS